MKILMIILQIFGGLTFIPWFMVAGLSFMVFNTPNSIKKAFPWVLIFLIFSYPFVLAGCYWWSWSNVSSSDYKIGCLWSCLPIVVFFIGYLLISRQTDLLSKNKKR